MTRLSRWHLFKIMAKSLFANGILYGSESVRKDSNKLSCDSLSFKSGEKFYIVELTVVKADIGGE